jgi:hypothetical protein
LIGADLAWKFGVKPFLDDVQKTATAVGRLNDEVARLTSKRFTVRGKFKDSTTQSWGDSGLNPTTLGSWTTVNTYTRKTETTFVVGAIKRLNPTKIPTMDTLKWALIRDQLGLTLNATDIWEVIPYSFVVDWFLPVQTFLEQFATQPASDWIIAEGWWRSAKTETNGTATEVIQPYAPGNNTVTDVSGNTSICPWRYTTYSRERLNSPPSGLNVPIYIPEIKLPNVGQMFTGIELALQRISKLLK